MPTLNAPSAEPRNVGAMPASPHGIKLRVWRAGRGSGMIAVLEPTMPPRSAPMTSLTQVAARMQRVLTTVAEEAAHATGCVQRRRVFDGARWVQALVFGCLGTPRPSLEALAQRAAGLGVAVTPQALDQRFTAGAACRERVLAAAVATPVVADPGGDPAAAPLRRGGPAGHHQHRAARRAGGGVAGVRQRGAPHRRHAEAGGAPGPEHRGAGRSGPGGGAHPRPGHRRGSRPGAGGGAAVGRPGVLEAGRSARSGGGRHLGCRGCRRRRPSATPPIGAGPWARCWRRRRTTR